MLYVSPSGFGGCLHLRLKAMPLGQRCSASAICSTKLFSISCSTRAWVISSRSLALDQLLSQTESSGAGSGVFGLGPQRPTDCSGEKAPVGMPSCRRDAILESGPSGHAAVGVCQTRSLIQCLPLLRRKLSNLFWYY